MAVTPITTPVADVGSGTTIAFATTKFTAIIQKVHNSGRSRKHFEVTPLGATTDATHIPDAVVEPGELELDILYDPDTDVDLLSGTGGASGVPIRAPAEAITITFPLLAGAASAASVAGSGFFVESSEVIPLHEKMTCKIKIKKTGAWVYTRATS